METLWLVMGIASVGLALAVAVLAVIKLKDRPGGVLFSIKYFAVLPVYVLSRLMQPGPESISEDAFLDFMRSVVLSSGLMALASGLAGVGLLKLMAPRTR